MTVWQHVSSGRAVSGATGDRVIVSSTADLHATTRAGLLLGAAAPNDEQRATAFEKMDGLLLSGGADIDPARYNEPVDGAVGIEPARDALEWAALDAADRRGIPVFGICRGLQFLNVHRGGSLLQHVEGQVGAAYPATPALTHPLDVQPETRAPAARCHPVPATPAAAADAR